MVVSGTLSGGGAERFASNLLCNLDYRRFEATLTLLRDEVVFSVPAHIPRTVLDHRGVLSTVQTIGRMRDAIDQIDPDLILSTMDSNGKFVGAALRTTESQPVWLARTSNNHSFKYRGIRGKLNKLWLQHVFPRADHFVANSMGLADSFREFYPLAKDRTRVIGNPVDRDQIEELAGAASVEPKVPTILFMGRLVPQKRLDVLLDAFRQIVTRRKANLLICGDGPLRSEIVQRIARYQLGDSVRLIGYRDNPFPILRAAKLFLSTSDYEGLPNSLLEAQALGIPAVATDCQFGPAEIIDHGETGLLVETGQPSAVADAVDQLLSNPDRLREMSIAAKEHTRRKYGVAIIMAQWMNFLEEASGIRNALKCSPAKSA